MNNLNKKIIELNELAHIISDLKSEGKAVSLCHGCFDLLHIGHMKHFESAKKAGDVLVVTVTPDHLVNKGPGRPAFPEKLRMEALAALEMIDYVALNYWETAIKTLELLKPTFYVKGNDYRDFEKDLTGNIQLEVDAVRAAGGDIYFTDEITFSSSTLINSHFNPHSESAQEYIHQLKMTYTTEQIIDVLEGLSDVRVLVIGDTIIDEYHYIRSLGKSSKSPTLSTKFLHAEIFAGGVLAIANHLNEFAKEVQLLTMLGQENDQLDVIQPKISPEINTKYFYRPDGPTPTKRRYMAEYLNAKVFEVTFMNDEYPGDDLEQQMITYLKTQIPHYDMVLIADFGHGCITPGVQKFLAEADIFVAVNAQTNSNNYGYNYITKYRSVDYISIDENEIRLPFGDRYGDLEDLILQLAELTQCSNITITQGQKGAIYYSGGKFNRAPAFATSVLDSVGAGDAVLSITSLCAYNNCQPDLLRFIGNCVGAIAVQILGNERPVNKIELKKMISHMLK
jgi:rfaE bifunctional protein nucleotidyltransferase chain/domain